MRKHLLHCFFIPVLLAGCAAPTQAPSPQPAIAPSLTPSLSATLTHPAPTASPTPLPSLTFTPSSTTAPRKKEPLRLISAAVSPSQAWSAAVLVEDGSFFLQVVSSDVPLVIWTIAEQETNEIRGYPLPLGWAADEQVLYYTHQSNDRDGCFGSWSARGRDVWQLDLISGATSQVSKKLGHWLALSPDGTQIAFLSSEHRDEPGPEDFVGIFNLATGKTTRAPIAFLTVQEKPATSLDLLWSPDGRSLVFGVLTNACGEESEDRYSIFRVDANTLNQEVLVRESEEWLQPVKWSEPGRVLIHHREGGFSWLNLNSRKLEVWP